jgi:hypothetical protein
MATQFRPQEGTVQLAAPDPGYNGTSQGLFWLSGEVREWQVPLDGGPGAMRVHSAVVRLWLPRTRLFSAVAFDGHGQILGRSIGAKRDTLDDLRTQIEQH